MRVCVLAGEFPVQSETFVIQHVTGLIDRGIDVHVIGRGGDPKVLESLTEYREGLKGHIWHYGLPGSKLERLGRMFGLTWRNISRGNWRYFKSWNFFRYGKATLNLSLPFLYDTALQLGEVDVLHCHFGPAGILGAHLKSLGFTKKLVVTFHGYDVSHVLKSQSRRNIYRNLFERADLILPVSDHWREQLLSLGAPGERMVTHRMGVDEGRFGYRERSPRASELRIITTARFVEKKGLQYAIEAVAKVVSSMPELQLRYDVIGNGPLWDSIRLLVEQHRLQDVVVLHGELTHEKVQLLLASSDVFLLPSVTASNGDQEGIPVALMEAMASGMPVLSTQHSGIPELIEDGISGFLVPERDVEALADGLMHLAKNGSTWSSLGRAGRKRIVRDYNIKRLNDRLVTMYRSFF